MIVLALDTAGGSCGVAVLRDGAVLARRLQVMARGQAEALVPLVDACLAEAAVAPGAIGLIGVTVGPGAFTGLRLGLAAAGGYALALGCGIVGVTTLEAHAAAVLPFAPPTPAPPTPAPPTPAPPTSALAPPAPPLLMPRAVIAAVDSRREEPFVQAFAAPAGPAGQARAGAVAPRPLGPPLCLAPAELAAGLAAALGDAGPVPRGPVPRGPVPPGPVIVVGDAAGPVAEALAAAGWAVCRAPLAGTPEAGAPEAGAPEPEASAGEAQRVDPAVVGRLAAGRAGQARPDPPPPLYLRPPDAVPAPPPRPIRA